MALYAIGDLHLHFQADVKARGQLLDPVWRNHEATFRRNCAMIRPTDTLVLVIDSPCIRASYSFRRLPD